MKMLGMWLQYTWVRAEGIEGPLLFHLVRKCMEIGHIGM